MSDTRKFFIRQQKRSVAQEKKIATQMPGGRRVAGSGSLPGNKGDVKARLWLVEAKMTKRPSFTLTLGLWRKIEIEALKSSGYKRPVMQLELAGRKLAVLDWNDYLGLVSVEEDALLTFD